MEETKKAQIAYNSNPFTLSFDALGRFFKHNVAWAIVIISFAIFGFLGQVGQGIANIGAGSESDSSYESFEADTTLPDTGSPSEALETTAILAIVGIVGIFVIVGMIVGTVIGVYLQGMFSYVALQSEKEKSVSFSEAFQAVTQRFWRLFGAQLLATVKIIGWSFLFIVPGIIAAIRYSMLPFVIMSSDAAEKGVGVAHDKTKTLVHKRLFEVFGVGFVGGLIPVIGGLLDLSGKAALHNQLKAYNDAGQAKPPIHFLNYLGLILIGVFALMVVLLAGVIIALAAGSTSP